jgi:hypothetical protein
MSFGSDRPHLSDVVPLAFLQQAIVMSAVQPSLVAAGLVDAAIQRPDIEGIALLAFRPAAGGYRANHPPTLVTTAVCHTPPVPARNLVTTGANSGLGTGSEFS